MIEYISSTCKENIHYFIEKKKRKIGTHRRQRTQELHSHKCQRLLLSRVTFHSPDQTWPVQNRTVLHWNPVSWSYFFFNIIYLLENGLRNMILRIGSFFHFEVLVFFFFFFNIKIIYIYIFPFFPFSFTAQHFPSLFKIVVFLAILNLLNHVTI